MTLLIWKIATERTFKILVINLNLEVMEVLSGVNMEAYLVHLISDGKTYLWAKQQMGAVDVVVHGVLQLWFEGLLVDYKEVNVLIGHDLDADVASDEVDGASHIGKRVIPGPLPSLFINFEEKYRTRRPGYESLSVKKVHVSEISSILCNFFNSCLRWVKSIDSESMSLPIKYVTVSGNLTIKRLNGKVGICAVLELSHDGLGHDFLFLVRIYEMVLLFVESMIDRDEHLGVL